MDVKFTSTTSARLSQLPITNGQIIYLSDKDASFYDIGNTRRSVSGVKFVASLPQSGVTDIIYVVISNGDAVLYVWDTTSSTFLSISGGGSTPAEITVAQYKALPASQKTSDYIYFITDANSMSDLSD